MARQLGQRNIKYGEFCQCNKCYGEYLKTKDNFYFDSKGGLITYTCKDCYQANQRLISSGVYETKTQTHIKSGETCTCNKCKLPFAKTPDNFYYRSNNIIRSYVCKGCYYSVEKSRLYESRAKAKEPKPERKQVLLEIVKTRTFPKGHPMNPTKEQRQALIDKIDSRRVYKNESRND